MSFEEIKELAKNSPFLLLMLLVLWQYRRDYLKVIHNSEQRSSEFIELLKQVVTALVDNKNASLANKAATEENTRIIDRYFNEDKRVQKVRHSGDRSDPR